MISFSFMGLNNQTAQILNKNFKEGQKLLHECVNRTSNCNLKGSALNNIATSAWFAKKHAVSKTGDLKSRDSTEEIIKSSENCINLFKRALESLEGDIIRLRGCLGTKERVFP
jgi:hypothetical protein